MSPAPSVLLFGPGAVGAFYGSVLAKSGCEVSVVARSGASDIQTNGITINSHSLGEWTFRPHQVFATVPSMSTVDVIILSAKAIRNYSEDLRPAVHSQTRILILQNGIDVEAPYQLAYPNNVIGSGLAFVCANRQSVTHVNHIDYGRIVVGRYDQGDDPVLLNVVDRFNHYGVPAKYSSTSRLDRWRKMVWNVGFNPISAIVRSTTDVVLAIPELEAVCRAAMAEVMAIAAADGYPLSIDTVERNISDTRLMTPYKTSMLLDVEAGRPIERGAILANAIRLADRMGVPVPTMKTLNALLKGINHD